MKLQLNNEAPDFSLLNTEGEEVKLSDFRGKRQVVILFFPLAFSSVCTNEVCTVRDNLKSYDVVDAEVLGISVDSFYALRAFKKAQNINFRLLSDFNKDVSATYGVLQENFHGLNGVSKRASFVIDKKGKLQYQEILDDAGKLPDFEELQKALE